VSFNLLFWILLFTFVFAVRYTDGGETGFHQLRFKIDPIRIYGNGLLLGITVGIFYSIMEIYLKAKGIYRFSLVRIIINRILIQSFVTIAILAIIAYLNFVLDSKKDLTISGWIGLKNYLFGATLLFLYIAGFIGNIILSVYRTLQMKIGEENFFNLLVGKYKPSQEENRAFLFLDLKSSTTIAEQLGHKKYSYFIQDCFTDLHPAILASKADIYQYVGDEAVLTWKSETAIEANNCLRAFFEYEKQLQKREAYYKKNYGLVPVFKGGLNIGLVMTAEVGVIKRDIAYHSDVLNTAARIQGLCNNKNAKLLASNKLIEKLTDLDNYKINEKGEVFLRGKQQKVEIVEVLEIDSIT
jgi:adenylate cyclase